jgi:hypothetical protein
VDEVNTFNSVGRPSLLKNKMGSMQRGNNKIKTLAIINHISVTGANGRLYMLFKKTEMQT